MKSMDLLKQSPKGRVFVYLLILFMGISTSCQKNKGQNETPAPVAQTPAPTPTNPSECVTQASADNGKEIPGQYIIKYKAMSTMAANGLPGFVKKAGIPEKLFSKIYAGQFHAAVAKLNYEQLQSVKNDENVEAVEPDRVVSIVSCATVQPAQTTPWGVARVGGGDGSGKTIWIIDTGVDLQHPDLNIDASRCVSFISGATPNDDHGHGTHVAGIIAAKNNNIGVIGVAANATIVALKVMDASGSGSSSTVMQAVNYVAQHGKAGDVVNMSVGGDVSDVLDNAVRDAAGKGILFAIAAGNAHTDASNSSPARVNATNVFTVSAINNQDEFATFSNYGASVDYAAPGVNITSTYKNQSYATMSGTSMATPHMAGLLLLKGRNIITDGFAKDDPDGHADPIAHK